MDAETARSQIHQNLYLFWDLGNSWPQGREVSLPAGNICQCQCATSHSTLSHSTQTGAYANTHADQEHPNNVYVGLSVCLFVCLFVYVCLSFRHNSQRLYLAILLYILKKPMTPLLMFHLSLLRRTTYNTYHMILCDRKKLFHFLTHPVGLGLYVAAAAAGECQQCLPRVLINGTRNIVIRRQRSSYMQLHTSSTRYSVDLTSLVAL